MVFTMNLRNSRSPFGGLTGETLLQTMSLSGAEAALLFLPVSLKAASAELECDIVSKISIEVNEILDSLDNGSTQKWRYN